MDVSIDVRQFCDEALERAKQYGATYADIRILQRENESIRLRTGKVEGLNHNTSLGFGIRVIVDGAWGFACSPNMTLEEADRVAEEATKVARASAMVKRKDVKLADVEPHVGSHKMEWDVDPFDVSLEQKIGMLKDVDEALRQYDKIKMTNCFMQFWKYNEVFASSEGSYIEQQRVESGAGASATAMEAGEIQRRSIPCVFGGDYAAAGFEFIEALQLLDNAEQTAQEAIELLSAPPCPSGVNDIILDGSMLALQVHESCGHPTELDRVFGMEASFAGTSFLTTEKLNNFRYGSDIVNLTADATLPRSMGSFAYDDEGVPAQRVDLVKEGIFSGYQSSRETASELGLPSSGGMRADNWNRIPLIRMTNVSLLPGNWAFDELIKDTKDGIFMSNDISWSIDDRRLNFQFGPEIAWEVKDGSIGRIFKNPIYSGITPDFWQSCDAICNEDDWRIWCFPNCGKGEPAQLGHVGHGVAPSRFRKVRTEGTK